TTVATGLDNPRGLVMLDAKTLAFAEAGHAGNVCLGPFLCMGLNGQISKLDLSRGQHTALASGLPSFSGPFGAFGLGGVTMQGGQLYFVNGLNPQYFRSLADGCKGQHDQGACVKLLIAFEAQS